MALINPQHLFDQADALIRRRGPGALRQTNIRRAFSAAYYGLFHAILTAAADEAVGVSMRSSPPWSLAYRSVSHVWLKQVCLEVLKSSMSPRFHAFRPAAGFGTQVANIADALIELQDKRHAADYDPLVAFLPFDAVIAIQRARTADEDLRDLRGEHRKAFLFLILFQPR